MSWRKYLVIPQLIYYGVRAPRRQAAAWDRFWGGIGKTGASGDVLWDIDHGTDIAGMLERLGVYLDPALPVADVGCGNGRWTRALASRFPRALGLDLSPQAVARAQAESRDVGNAAFRTADVTAPGLGKQLVDELGPMNIFVRGVLHVMDHEGRLAAVRNFKDMLGERGALYLSETNIPSPLDHLEFQGATATSMPDPLRRCVAAGIRPPAHFADKEVRIYFPQSEWDVLASSPGIDHTLPLHRGGDMDDIPCHVAAVRPRSRRDPVPGSR